MTKTLQKTDSDTTNSCNDTYRFANGNVDKYAYKLLQEIKERLGLSTEEAVRKKAYKALFRMWREQGEEEVGIL